MTGPGNKGPIGGGSGVAGETGNEVGREGGKRVGGGENTGPTGEGDGVVGETGKAIGTGGGVGFGKGEGLVAGPDAVVGVDVGVEPDGTGPPYPGLAPTLPAPAPPAPPRDTSWTGEKLLDARTALFGDGAPEPAVADDLAGKPTAATVANGGQTAGALRTARWA